ncbi:ipis-1-like [Amblyomma americanum]
MCIGPAVAWVQQQLYNTRIKLPFGLYEKYENEDKWQSRTDPTATLSPSLPLYEGVEQDVRSSSTEGSRLPSDSAARRKVVADLNKAVLKFGVDLYHTVLSGPAVRSGMTRHNVLFSPYLIASTLQMMQSGARGETGAQLARLFSLPTQQEQQPGNPSPSEDLVARYFARRDRRLFPDDTDHLRTGFTVQYDCCLHRDRRVLLKQEFEARLSHTRGSHSRQSESAGNSSRGRPRHRRLRSCTHDFVNDSVHQRWKMETQLVDAVPLLGNGASNETLPRGIVDQNTSLLLLSALGVKGRWRRRFDPTRVCEGVFYEASVAAADEEQRFAPHAVIMMHRTGNFRMADCGELEATALELPYKHGSRYLIVFLPLRRDGLADLEARMTAANLMQCLRALKRRDNVDLSLPKFHARGIVDLGSALSAMGVDALFRQDVADLSGMCNSEGAFVSAARHAAAFPRGRVPCHLEGPRQPQRAAHFGARA